MAKMYEGVGVNDIKQENLTERYKELYSLIGLENTLLVYKAFKGQQISFSVRIISQECIHDQIISEYNGSNIKEISKKYGYSERWVRELIKR